MAIHNSPLTKRPGLRTNLAEANLSRAKLLVLRTNLSRANLAKATNLTQNQIELAKGNELTLLPQHLKRPAHWSRSSDEQQNEVTRGPSNE